MTNTRTHVHSVRSRWIVYGKNVLFVDFCYVFVRLSQMCAAVLFYAYIVFVRRCRRRCCCCCYAALVEVCSIKHAVNRIVSVTLLNYAMHRRYFVVVTAISISHSHQFIIHYIKTHCSVSSFFFILFSLSSSPLLFRLNLFQLVHKCL